MKENNLISKDKIQLAFPKINKKGEPIAYRRKRCRCTLNHMHDSKFEARHCNHLNVLKKAGEIKDFKIQPHYVFKVNGKRVCGHYPDFIIEHLDGTCEINECKSAGTKTEAWKLKKALFEVLYPEIPYTVIWM
jgi:hypothetical protein